MIPDEVVRQLFSDAMNKWDSKNLQKIKTSGQIYRGIRRHLWKNNPHPYGCERHMVVFEKYTAIPEYCFDCYKIYLEPRNVVELFKLMMVMHIMEPPFDNTRKCMIENRPQMPGYYKGYIYCQGLSDAKQVLEITQSMISDLVSDDMPISIKRGCSEFSAEYPKYGIAEVGVAPEMNYREEWRKHEEYVDQNLIGHLVKDVEKPGGDNYNEADITLRDAAIMRTWIIYAATIGDTSYRKITGYTVKPVSNINRPPYM